MPTPAQRRRLFTDRLPPFVAGGFVSEYRFDAGGGLVLKDYRSGFDGTLGTGGSDQPDWVAAGLDFVPGNSDVITVAGMPDSVLLGPLTISVVCQIDTGNAFRHFLSKNTSNGATQEPAQFRTNSEATPTLSWGRANNSALKIFNGPSTTLNTYCMYSVTVADGNCDTTPMFYVGATPTAGTVAAGSATGAATGTGAPLRIGRRGDGAVQMDGIKSYMLIYSRELSATEMAKNYAAVKARLAPRGITLP